MRTLVWSARIALVLLAGCRRAERERIDAQDAKVPQAPASVPEAFTFGYETRDHQLWLHTGTDPQLYTVKTKDDEIVASGIDDRRLELDFPALHELVHGESQLIDVIDY